MMVRIPYVTVGGELRIYEYMPPHRWTAAQSCYGSIARGGPLRRVGKARWASGRRSFNNSTVQELVRRGRVVIDGNLARLA